MAEVTLRRATPLDAGAVASLGAEVLPATYGPIDPALARHQLDTWWAEEVLAERIAALPHWVAESADGTVHGVSDLGRLDGRPVVWKMYLRPVSQGHGLGRQLLARAVAEAAGEDVWLDVFAENERALGFYRSQGFEVVPDADTTTVLGHPMLRMRRPA